MKEKLQMFKELAFVYIVNGKKFLCKKKADRYLEKLNYEGDSEDHPDIMDSWIS